MAGLEGLTSTIYHEKQQSGSMLCAQHALNSLLQGNYFTAPDLSAIAQNLDTLEDSYRDEEAEENRNMDDTGFFSVQVLEHALSVWGLNLVRWRSEEMRPYNDHPHTQLAFILHLEQHWFTLRRFGPALPNLGEDPGEGHWYNLNSFLADPEWVGKLYLGMVLQQAETEGYSVFAVTQADPEAPLALPRTLADEIAATLPEPSSASSSTSRNAFQRTSFPSTHNASSQHETSNMDSFEDEDYELQAALQASLMHGDDTMDLDDAPVPPPIASRFTVPLPPSGMQSPEFPALGSGLQTPQRADSGSLEHEELDPVAASMARNQQLLQHMQRQQAYAAQDVWSEEELNPEEAEALRQRREERRRQEEEEEEQLRLAIEESERMARERDQQSSSSDPEGTKGDTESDEEIDEAAGNQPHSAPAFIPSAAYYSNDRVYDDDDAELQAALKASLEGVAPGFQHPALPEPVKPTHTSSLQTTPPMPSAAALDKDETSSIASTESEAPVPEPTEELSIEEIRRRRLARFGGA